MMVAASLMLLAGCGSRTIDVNYNAEAAQASGSDWFPIPIDQSRQVTSAEPAIQRPPVSVNEPLFPGDVTGLTVTEFVDSFGNTSLVVNRDAEFTWELLDAAVSRLEWAVADRNRNEYQLVLQDPDRRGGLFGWLRPQGEARQQRVQLILVPRIETTGISAVYADEQVLPADENQRLMTELKAELLQES
ncbi:MAG: hypothetical protein ACX931_05330 [Saccharospirillum sp.]